MTSTSSNQCECDQCDGDCCKVPEVVETMGAVEGTIAMNEAWAELNRVLDAADAMPDPIITEEGQHQSDGMVRLVLRVPKDNCQHTDKKEIRPNRFECDDCGSSWRFVRKSAIRRRMMLK